MKVGLAHKPKAIALNCLKRNLASVILADCLKISAAQKTIAWRTGNAMEDKILRQAAVLSKDQFNRLTKLSGLGRHGKRDLLAVLFSFGTGLRVMEIAALKVKDVLTDSGDIIEQVVLQKTKGKKKRSIYIIDKKLKEAIQVYVEERKLSKKHPFNPNQALILSQRGISFSNRSLQKLFERLYRQCGLSGASSHSGRRTFATRLIERGVDIKSLSVLLGHSSIAMTARYVQENPERLKRITMEALY